MVMLGLLVLFLLFILGIMFMLAWGAYSYREDQLHQGDRGKDEDGETQ